MTLQDIRINWKAYFDSFTAIHGGNPVNYKERLLFPDAWQYHRTNYSGPEFPAPSDPSELCRLQLAYWNICKQQITATLRKGETQLSHLKWVTETHSAPITILKREVDEETGKLRRVEDSLDLEQLEQELKFLDTELEECYSKINELQSQQMQSMRQGINYVKA